MQIVTSSLSQIQGGLSASADEIAWVQTAYLIADVVMVPMSGIMSRLGGWNVFFTLIDRSIPNIHPFGNPNLRADGKAAYDGWPDSPQIEELRRRRSRPRQPATTDSSSARSAALRAIGPITARSPRPGIAGVCGGPEPRCGMRSRLGLCENTPQKCAGARSEPPMSEPSFNGTKPVASAAAAPPDEPPGVRVGCHGLWSCVDLVVALPVAEPERHDSRDMIPLIGTITTSAIRYAVCTHAISSALADSPPWIWLSELVTTRVLFVVATLGFTGTSALCATATSLGQMIVYRAMQGFCGGAMTPTVWPVVYTKFRGQQLATVISCRTCRCRRRNRPGYDRDDYE